MYCLRYYPSEKYLEQADQLRITYRAADRTLEDFLKKYSDKSIVIDIDEEFDDIDAKLFYGLNEKYGNIKLIVKYSNQLALEKIQKNNIPFFFFDPVSSIDKLMGLLQYHPTDMYICEELGFHLDKVSKILHDNNVKVRAFPNICQSSFPETPSLKTFFIRPEDIPVYSMFIDVFEFMVDKGRQAVVFKIYKQEKWFGEINELIPTFKGSLDSKYVLDSFGIVRTKCGKRCMYKPGSCQVCERYLDTAETFKENGIVIHRESKTD